MFHAKVRFIAIQCFSYNQILDLNQ